jgi:hypothetical protein
MNQQQVQPTYSGGVPRLQQVPPQGVVLQQATPSPLDNSINVMLAAMLVTVLRHCSENVVNKYERAMIQQLFKESRVTISSVEMYADRCSKK